MSIDLFSGAPMDARRQLWRESMTQHGADIAWLSEHSLIPEHATVDAEDMFPDEFYRFSAWMLEKVSDWAVDVHGRLDYAGTFERHGLTPDERVGVRTLMREKTIASLAPGISAVGETHAAVAAVAKREGVPQELWGDIASRARLFAASIAVDGTLAQALVRNYLAGKTSTERVDKWQPGRLKLDEETGITTVVPIDDLIETAKEAAKKYFPDTFDTKTCLALQAPVRGLDGNVTMFDAVWDAYSYGAEQYMFPRLAAQGRHVEAEQPPDPHYREALNTIAYNDSIRMLPRVLYLDL